MIDKHKLLKTIDINIPENAEINMITFRYKYKYIDSISLEITISDNKYINLLDPTRILNNLSKYVFNNPSEIKDFLNYSRIELCDELVSYIDISFEDEGCQKSWNGYFTSNISIFQLIDILQECVINEKGRTGFIDSRKLYSLILSKCKNIPKYIPENPHIVFKYQKENDSAVYFVKVSKYIDLEMRNLLSNSFHGGITTANYFNTDSFVKEMETFKLGIIYAEDNEITLEFPYTNDDIKPKFSWNELVDLLYKAEGKDDIKPSDNIKDQRPSWDEYFMEITHVVKKRSTCLSRQVGAVIVKDKRIITTGYNGAASGMTHCLETGCIRKEMNIPSGQRHELCKAIHAEQNAIIQAAKLGLSIEGATLYCTTAPCAICAKMIINSGITKVIYDSEYPDELAMEYFKEAGVEVIQYKK